MSEVLLHLDLHTGVSGDKLLAALLDAGASLQAVNDALAAVDPSLSVTASSVRAGGIAAARLEVTYTGTPPERDWRDLRGMLEAATLSDPSRRFAARAFLALAEAEAKVHGVPVEEVHFHEVGAIDTLADIVGVAAALEDLAITRVTASRVAIGWGTVETEHGVLPVPAPATAELLAGMPVESGADPSELTTPTGAALLHALEPSFEPLPPSRVVATGHGAGTREEPVPNVLRAILTEPGVPEEASEVTVLRTVLDHLTPEETSFALDRLLEKGALDAWLTPIVMKKGRPAVELTALAPPEDAHTLTSALIALTGTLGVRVERASRVTLERSVWTCETSFGPVRFKVATDTAGQSLLRPEHDDCAAIARRTGMRLRDVARQVTEDAESAIG